MPSIFSKIISREIPGQIVYEDDHVIAFLDINPVNPGHTLVVPKNEQPNIIESSEEDLLYVLRAVRKLAPAIVKAVGADGFNTVTNTGEASGQSVPHTHFHIIPRFKNDGHMPWAHTAMSGQELNEVADKIQQAL
jgi:histidine triad (HIT) family protein